MIRLTIMPASPDAHSVLKQEVADGRSWQDILRFITAGYYIDSNHLLRGGVSRVELVNPEASAQGFIQPRSAILHSNAGSYKTSWMSLIRFWRRSDITLEAHFQVDGVDASDINSAVIVQAIPLNRRADCNSRANSWSWNGRQYGAISFETQDRGSANLAYTPWSLPQLHAMIGALTCICVVYGVQCSEPAYWNSSGIGYHSRFREWSIYVGKTCPGAARIRQMGYIREQVARNLAAFSENTGWQCGQGAV